MAKPFALYYATIGRPIGSDNCDRTTWSPSIAQSLPPTELPSGQQLHACCMQLSITAGGLLEYCTALCVGYLPMRLTSLHGARSCRGKEGKEKKKKRASLGSQVPQPISAVAIRFHQHSRPSSNILTLCPFRRSPSSELSLTSADRPISLATRGYGVTTRGRSD